MLIVSVVAFTQIRRCFKCFQQKCFNPLRRCFINLGASHFVCVRFILGRSRRVCVEKLMCFQYIQWSTDGMETALPDPYGTSNIPQTHARLIKFTESDAAADDHAHFPPNHCQGAPNAPFWWLFKITNTHGHHKRKGRICILIAWQAAVST